MNERFTTRNLAEILAVQTGMDKERAGKFIDVLSSYIAEGIKRNKFVKVLGLGTFKIVLVRERESVHIHTGERFVIPAHHKISYIPDKDLKEQINRPFAFFEPIEASEDLYSLLKQTGENVTEKDAESEVDYYMAESEIVRGDIEPGEPVVVIDNDEMQPDATENTAEDTEHLYSGGDREYDYISETAKYYPITETAEEEVFVSEPAMNGQMAVTGVEVEDDVFIPELPVETDDKPVVSGELADNVDVINYDYEYGVANTYRRQREDDDTAYIDTKIRDERVRDKMINDGRLQDEKKKTIMNAAPLWLWFLILPFLIVTGAGIATYAFLYFNTNVSSENVSQPVNDSQATAAVLNDAAATSPLPIGEVRLPDTDDSMTGAENEAGTGQANGENIAPADSAGNSVADKKEERRVIDWFSHVPETAEQAGNQNKRKETPATASANTATTASDSRQTGQRNTNRTTAAATNKPQNTPAEKTIPARIRMTAGSSLTQIAMEHYGDKVFWVYIYEHNKSRIKDFNNIPAGMELYLPRPNAYGINAKNKTSVQKARQKQSELLKWDKWDDYR
ncbi:MAG: HU family DNA-binding protein [Tannerella sp.]|jgi:nucleoid DNA-binding protein|nr:HU family DNA-binding protein [Tannerella sp.]